MSSVGETQESPRRLLILVQTALVYSQAWNIWAHDSASFPQRLPRKQIRLSRVQGNGGNKVPDLEEHRIGARFRIDPPSGSQSSVQKKELFPSPSTILHPAARQCSAFLSCGDVKDTQWRSG
uniref:Uncharacterized protein n=1 Tax=Oryza glaberrima TaxID=4538 RepID=I1PNM8_ORYGL